MQITLSIPNRAWAKLVLQGIQMGSIIEMRLRKEGIQALDFDKEDLKTYGLTINTQTGDITWPAGSNEKMWEGEISEGVYNLLVGRLEQLSQGKQFNAALLPLADALKVEMPEAESTVSKKHKKK